MGVTPPSPRQVQVKQSAVKTNTSAAPPPPAAAAPPAIAAPEQPDVLPPEQKPTGPGKVLLRWNY